MIETLFFYIGLLALFGVWHAWKLVSLDACRDSLFDLREQMREHFINQNIPLDSPAYKNQRDYLNAQIRFVKDHTLLDLYLSHRIYTNEKLKKQVKKEIEAHYKIEDEELNDFCEKIRIKAETRISYYLVETNFLAISISFFLLICVLLSILMAKQKQKLANLKQSVAQKMIRWIFNDDLEVIAYRKHSCLP